MSLLAKVDVVRLRRLLASLAATRTALALSFSVVLAQFAAPTPGWARPISLPNQFLLNSLHLSARPDEAQVVAASSWQADATFSWTNSFLTNEVYLLDLEQRDATFDVRYGINEKTEFSFSVPVHWRGGGILDQPIREWHDAFGLPEGDREDVRDDQFFVGGKTKGGTFAIDQQGFGLGNAQLRVKRELSSFGDASLLSTALTLGLPTAQSGFGQDGVDALLELLLGWSRGAWRVDSGLGALIISDRFEQGLEYRTASAEGFVHAAYERWDPVSIQVGLYGGSQSLDNVRTISDGFLYLDVALAYRFSDQNTCAFLVRENPYPSRSSADVSFIFNCGASWE